MDRDLIQRQDFPTGRRGYDITAVDDHLRRVADAFETNTAPPAPPSLAATTSEQVREILEAAERSVTEVRTRAGAEAADHVARVQTAADGMLAKLDHLESELTRLLTALRTSGEALSEGLSALQADVAQGISPAPPTESSPRSAAPVTPPPAESSPRAAAPVTPPPAESSPRAATPVTPPPAANSSSAPPAGSSPRDAAADSSPHAGDSSSTPVADSPLDSSAADSTSTSASDSSPPDAPSADSSSRPAADSPLDPSAADSPSAAADSSAPAAKARRRAAAPDSASAADSSSTPAADSPPAASDSPPVADADDLDSPDPDAAPTLFHTDDSGASISSDEASARLIALNMALNGNTREEAASYLAEHFELADPDALLDDVFARAGR